MRLRENGDSELELALVKAQVKAKLLGVSGVAPELGRFSLVRRLGRGSNGTGYVARDCRIGTELALKLLRTRDAPAIGAFKQEFRGLTHVVDEFLVQLHELFSEGEDWYFTMELVRGAPFTRYVRAARDETGGS